MNILTKTAGMVVVGVLLAASGAVTAQTSGQTSGQPGATGGGGQNLASNIIAARQKSAAMMVNYGWWVRTDISKDGNNQETRIQQVAYLPNGVPQYTTISDTKAPLPRGFLRRLATKDQEKEMEKYLAGVQQLVGQYTLPAPGAMYNFLSSATITSGTDPMGNAILQTTGTSVVVPGDTLTVVFDAATYAIKRMDMTTSFDNHAVTMSATFRTLPSGLTHMQYATVTVPDKSLAVQIHNYDYAPND